MGGIKRFDHVGITVADLDTAVQFFTDLGLEVEGRGRVEGDLLDTVCGIEGARTEVALLRLPNGETALELATFERPDVAPGRPGAMANESGIRNVCFEVADLRAEVERLAAEGYGLVRGIGEYENTWLMAYIRGPEGIVVSLSERID